MKNKKEIIIFVLALLVLILAYLFLNRQIVYPEVDKIYANDHIKWSIKSKDKLVEYSDFQCPACKSINELLKSFEASSSPYFEITKKTSLVFRHFPLYLTHKNALEIAYAAEAAGKQDKFFEMTDLLFENQEKLIESSNINELLISLAIKLKLDINLFKKNIISDEVKNKVKQDLSIGQKVGINSTPSFFLNGRKIEVNKIDDFIKLLLNQ